MGPGEEYQRELEAYYRQRSPNGYVREGDYPDHRNSRQTNRSIVHENPNAPNQAYYYDLYASDEDRARREGLARSDRPSAYDVGPNFGEEFRGYARGARQTNAQMHDLFGPQAAQGIRSEINRSNAYYDQTGIQRPTPDFSRLPPAPGVQAHADQDGNAFMRLRGRGIHPDNSMYDNYQILEGDDSAENRRAFSELYTSADGER